MAEVSELRGIMIRADVRPALLDLQWVDLTTQLYLGNPSPWRRLWLRGRLWLNRTYRNRVARG